MNVIRERTLEKVKILFDQEIQELFNLWEEIGVKKDTLDTYADQVYNHIAGLMKDMIDESLQKKKELLKNVKILAQSSRKLAKELGVDFATDSYDNLPLIELDVKLKEKVNELQQLKEDRLNYIEKLISKEIEVCKKLGNKPVGFNSEIPNDQEIQKFENYLKEQELEKNRLAEVFKVTRRSIVKMMDDLSISPSLDFEKIVYHDYNNFIYTPNNMTKLRDLKERLKDQIDEAKSQTKEKKDILISLWNYLDEPLEFRQNFLEMYSDYSLVTINALNSEIKRCKEKRSENIANYVTKVRSEIENLWKLCKYSELQKRSFTAMKCQTYTDDLLTLHEIEAEKLRKHYDNNNKIFELLNEWEIQFEKLKELDQRANDPDRYHNRGGQLLMEEKERKAAEKKLPKIENQLMNLVDNYEKIKKKTFLIYGTALGEYMNQVREKYEVEKENMKLARKQAKDSRSVRNTPLSTSKRTPGMSILRVTPASARLRTPGLTTTLSRTNLSRVTPSAKRKLPYDISPKSDLKKRVIVPTEKHKNTVLCNKVRRSGRLPGATFNGSGRAKSSNKKKRKSRSDTTLSVSSYGNFQDHLEKRDELRSSSILPDEKSKRVGVITPIKTPIKPVRRKIIAVSTPTPENMTRAMLKKSKLMNSSRLHPIENSTPI